MAAKEEEQIARKTISLAADIYQRALARARLLGFKNSFSAYIAWLIERDAESSATERERSHRSSGEHYRTEARVAEADERKDSKEGKIGFERKSSTTRKVLEVPQSHWDDAVKTRAHR